MKKLNQFIKESSSIYADLDMDYNKYPVSSTFLRYADGDMTFGELKPGDNIYYYSSELDDIIELTVKGKIRKKDARIVMSVEPFGEGRVKHTIIEFGPAYSSWMGNTGEQVDEYDSKNIPSSSLCISIDFSSVFGTNKESVKKIAHSSVMGELDAIKKKMEELQNKMNSLQQKIDRFV